MGKRKLRFTPCKNFERKKYAAESALIVSLPILYWSKRSAAAVTSSSSSSSSSPPSSSSSLSLQVHIPINLYLELSLSDPRAVIAKFINLKNSLPPAVQWNVETQVNTSSISTTPTCTIVSISKSFPFGTVRIEVSSDSNWTVYLNNVHVAIKSPQRADKLRSIAILLELLNKFNSSSICSGNSDPKFHPIQEKRKGKFLNSSGSLIAFYDDRALLSSPTIRHFDCPVFIRKDDTRCNLCDNFRSNLYSYLSRHKTTQSSQDLQLRKNPSSHTNYRWLSSPEKITWMQHMRKQNKALASKVNRLQKKLEESIEVNGIVLDDQMSNDLENIVKEEDRTMADKFPEDSFAHIFWSQQKAHILKDRNQKNGIRWHPLIIKLCLYLRHQSCKAYKTLRQSGCLVTSLSKNPQGLL